MRRFDELTAEELRKILRYDHETGLFWFLKAGGRKAINRPAGTVNNRTGYRTIGFGCERYPAHQLAWFYVKGVWPDGVVRHINGNRDDNRIENMTLHRLGKEPDLSADRLREILEYDSETGEFWWKVQSFTCTRDMTTPAGTTKKGNNYRYIGIDGKQFLAHRLAWVHFYGVWPDDQIDHVNGNRDDNRIDNLRQSTQAENTRNRGPQSNNTSGFKGVCWCIQTKKWRASVTVNGKTKCLGRYASKEMAHQAYCEGAEKLHGEFARFE